MLSSDRRNGHAAPPDPLGPAGRRALDRSIVDALPDPVALLDLDGTILFTNAASAGVFAGGRELGGRKWIDLLPHGLQGEGRQALAAARQGGRARLSVRQGAGPGPVRWWDIVVTPRVEEGAVTGLVVIARDVTREKASEEQVRWVANHDELTKLPNRTLFQDRLDALTGPAPAGGRPFGLLLIDVDDFKRINDTLGHDTGDALLCAIAERLVEATRSDDLVARLGGDEFAIILSCVRTEEELEAAIASVLGGLKRPCLYGGKMLDCQASIGASLYPKMGQDKSELMKNTDVALYAAKKDGRGASRIFEPQMRAEMQQRNSMLSLAKQAIESDLIAPYYQPKVDLRTARLNGFEALLRWRHPVHGMQAPDTISAAFKDPVLAADISDRMVDSVIADARAWLDAGVDFGHVAINASAADFRRGNFPERLLSRLAAAGLPTSRLQVEVTETVFLGRGAEYVERALKELSAAGIKIALDDFGTGFASLSHLKQFPVDIIKIDRSFVRDLHDDPEDEAIVRAVISLGKSLDIEVVAEGIETPAQSAYLRKHDCDFGQGFLFARARPAADVPALVAAMAARAERLSLTLGLAQSLGRDNPLRDLGDNRTAAATPCRCGHEQGRRVSIGDARRAEGTQAAR